jgi:hypothetical protein
MLFAVVYIAFRFVRSVTCTLVCCKRLSSLVGGRGKLATLAQEGLFSVFKGVGVAIVVEEALLSFQTAL